MGFNPVRITREADYYLCKITPKGMEILEIYPFSKAEQRRDTLQEASKKRLTEVRYCIRPMGDPEAERANGTSSR